MKKKKVILLTNIIPPYRIPIFNYINQKEDFDFKVIVLAEKEQNREWQLAKEKIKFDYRVLPGWHLFFRTKNKEIPIHLNSGILKTLFHDKPDIVITSGYDSLAYWIAFFYSKIFKKKYILWDETTLLSAGGIKGLRGLLKKIIIRGADRYIVSGTKAKEYLEYFGARSEDIFISLDTVDVDYFYDKAIRFRSSPDFLLGRNKYPKLLLLYVGQLIKRKGVGQVLKTLNILKDPEIGFIILGNGPEEKELKEFCKENKLQNIFFEGFHQQEELPKYYALADIFILSSFEEVWGLVANEALASGLYVLCSKYAGAAYDLINDEDGAIFNPENINEMVKLIKDTKNQIELIKSRREEIASGAKHNLSIEKSGEFFVRAIKSLII